MSQCTWENIKKEISDPSTFRDISSSSKIGLLSSPQSPKSIDSTFIFDKTHLCHNQSSEQFATKLTEVTSAYKQESKSKFQQIGVLKRKLQQITREQVKRVDQSSQLQKLFMQWVEDAKKEVSKRKSMSITPFRSISNPIILIFRI